MTGTNLERLGTHSLKNKSLSFARLGSNRYQGWPGSLRHRQIKGNQSFGEENAHIDVPQSAAGLPMIMLSETPAMPSRFPAAEASKR